MSIYDGRWTIDELLIRNESVNRILKIVNVSMMSIYDGRWTIDELPIRNKSVNRRSKIVNISTLQPSSSTQTPDKAGHR
jgi:hypothetical protein